MIFYEAFVKDIVIRLKKAKCYNIEIDKYGEDSSEIYEGEYISFRTNLSHLSFVLYISDNNAICATSLPGRNIWNFDITNPKFNPEELASQIIEYIRGAEILDDINNINTT